MDSKITQAIWLLESGEVICFPTETVYALACNAANEDAIRKIYGLKGRNFNKPLALLVENIEAAETFAQLDSRVVKLAEIFCPGALTFILPKKMDCPLPDILTSGLDTIAIRIPDNEIALNILQQAKCPVAATSANPAGKPEAVCAEEAVDYFSDHIPIIDGGKCRIGIASTIIDLTSPEIKILREGSVSRQQIVDIL